MAEAPTSAAHERNAQDLSEGPEAPDAVADGPHEGKNLAALYVEVAARQRTERQAQAKAAGLVLAEPSWARTARSMGVGKNSSILSAWKDRPAGTRGWAAAAMPAAPAVAHKLLGTAPGGGAAKILQSFARSEKVQILGLPGSALGSAGLFSAMKSRVITPEAAPWMKASLWGGVHGSIFDGFAAKASAAGLFKAAFGDQLGKWRLLADSIADAWPESARRAWAALQAAMQARATYLDGRLELKARNQAIDDFIRTVLQLTPTPWHRDAVVDVLLDQDDWMPHDSTPIGDLDVLPDITRSLQQRVRGHKPVWKTELRGHAIDLLDQPSGRADDGTLMTLLDKLPAPGEAFADLFEGMYDDPRIDKVLKRLKPEELRVAMAYAHGTGEMENWPETALAANVPRKYAESVGRKLHREGREVQRRTAAMNGPARA